MTIQKLTLPALAACLLVTGCETTSDPRQGGLFSYWATGDAGYQERLNQRERVLNEQESRTARVESSNAALRGRKARLSNLSRKAASTPGGSEIAGRVKALERRADSGQISDADLEARLRQLEADVSALQAPASLTLQSQ